MYLTKLKKKKLKLKFSIKKRQCCKRTLTTHFRFGETYSLALSTCVWHRVHSAWSVPGPSPEPCFCLLHLPFCFIKKQIPFPESSHFCKKELLTSPLAHAHQIPSNFTSNSQRFGKVGWWGLCNNKPHLLNAIQLHC